jgi:putative addiction module component (TIGR02574 family)
MGDNAQGNIYPRAEPCFGTAKRYYFDMSKSEILDELPKLNPAERRELLERLWDLEEHDLVLGVEPTAAEKSLLDQELEEYRQNPHAGTPWSEVKKRLQKPSIS